VAAGVELACQRCLVTLVVTTLGASTLLLAGVVQERGQYFIGRKTSLPFHFSSSVLHHMITMYLHFIYKILHLFVYCGLQCHSSETSKTQRSSVLQSQNTSNISVAVVWLAETVK